jgi:hypothetical protein
MINIFKILEEVETGGAAALMIWYIYICNVGATNIIRVPLQMRCRPKVAS